MKSYPIYCGGEFLVTSDILDVTDPYEGQVFAKTFRAGEPELEKAIEAALGCETMMKNMPGYLRTEILNKIADAIESHKHLLADILGKESGKPAKYSIGEVSRAVQTFRIAAEECRRLPGEYLSLDWTPAGENKEGLVKYFPIGLVSGIAPFNFPLNLAVHKIAPAIAAGCPIILKPSSGTPLSTLLLAQLIDDTALPKGALSILPMSREAGNQLVTDPRFKLLTFTGSPKVGWDMKSHAGKKKVVLELGGNAGVIIAQDADLDMAVPKCVSGGFAYSGQVCIHTQRIFVHNSIFKQFSERFVNEVKNLKSGNPTDPDTDISVMIDEDNARRVESWVNEAIDDGARILCGGKREGAWYEPTVLINTNPKMKVCALEVFGPVVTIEPYDSFDKAVEMVNNSEYGLQAGVFTNSIDEMNIAFNQIEAGGVIINDVPTFRVDHMPYGGIKNSGTGREGIKYAIHDMMEPKILVKNL